MKAPAVTLLFPPFCLSAIDAPHLALPTLAAHLEAVAIPCATHDMNVRFYHWAKRPDGPFDLHARARIQKFRETQASDSVDASQSMDALLRDVACAPPRLVAQLCPEAVVTTEAKDLYNARDSIPKETDYQLALEIELWDTVVRESIAHTVTEAVAIQDRLLTGPLGEFLRTSEVDALLTSAARSPLVGVTIAFSLQLGAALAFAREVKRRSPTTKVVLGGSQITLLSDADIARLASLPFVDGVGRYEGELVLEALARATTGQGSWESVPSLVFRRADGTIQVNEPTRPIALNDLPVPRFNDDELHLYSTPALPVNVTRGCYWGKCTFCDYVKLMAPGQPRYVGRDPSKVVSDIKELQTRYRTFQFNLITEALPPKWAAAFSREILQRGIQATFWSYLKNEKKDIWSEDLLRLMSTAGIRSVTCGVESTTDRVLKVIDKGTTREVIEQNFQAFANVGIRAGFNLIPDYPTTTLAEAAEGLRFVLENRDIIPAINPQMFDLSIQSAVAGSPEQFGIELTGAPPTDTTHGAHSLGYRRREGMSDEERALVRDAYLDLRRELARHHLTTNSRRTIEVAGFRWERSRLLMHPGSRAVRSRVALDGSRREVVVLVRLDYGGGCVDLPAKYTSTVALLTTRNRGFIEFRTLEEAYLDDVLSVSNASRSDLDDAHRAELREACVELARAVALTGNGTVFASMDDAWLTDAMTSLLATPPPVDAALDEAPRRRLPLAQG